MLAPTLLGLLALSRVMAQTNQWIKSVINGTAPPQDALGNPAAPVPVLPTGKVDLPYTRNQIGDRLYEGSVYVDGKPVCDNSWDAKEAVVVCRMFGYSRGVERTNSYF